MKKIILLFLFIIFLSLIIFADTAITRGPDIGEIYFIGPTVTGEGIYRSTDFGETATCMDSISEVESICTDLTQGSLYRDRMPNCLYYSNNYGQYGSWVFRTAEGSYRLASGRNEGEIYKGIGRSSQDYGLNFTQHSCQGFFGEFKAFDIDNENDAGYALVRQYGVLDSLWLLISYDNYENLEIQHVFNDYIGTNRLTRGYENGELFLYRKHNLHGKKLLYSNDYGETWELKNTFNCPNLPIKSIVGGRQPGELYMIVEYVQLLSTIKYTHIYHSLDYGETFTIYHTFEYGPEPYYANFIATPSSGSAPLTVQFTDISNGENIQTWEWDFNDDGIIDSYEQNPEYTYQDSGLYRVTLRILPGMIDPELTASQYIHVSGNTGIDNEEIIENIDSKIQNYPNPFNPHTTIYYDLPDGIIRSEIFIYNIKGQLVDNLEIIDQQSVVSWNAVGFSSGIYLYKLNLKNSPIKKMLLLK